MNFDPTLQLAEDRIVLKYKGVASVMEILCYMLGTLGSPRGPGGPGSGPNSSPKPKNFWDLDIKTQFFVEIMLINEKHGQGTHCTTMGAKNWLLSGQNFSNFSFIFWAMRQFHKFILKFPDL